MYTPDLRRVDNRNGTELDLQSAVIVSRPEVIRKDNLMLVDMISDGCQAEDHCTPDGLRGVALS